MKSSGIKRGLAAIAISGLAVTAIPAIAMANSIDSQVTPAVGNLDVQLYNMNFSNSSIGVINMTAKNDGTDSTVRLEAGGGINVARVTFQVSRNFQPFNDIATVERNDDGAFFVEWTPAANGAFPGDSIRIRAINLDSPTPFIDSDTSTPQILRDASFADTQAININGEGDAPRGYWEDPAALGNYTLGVYGTTTRLNTSGADAPGIAHMDGFGAEQDFVYGNNLGDGTWEGVLPFSDATYTLDDPNLPPVEADQMVVRAVTDTTTGVNTQSDDFESFTLYQQALTGVTCTITPQTEPDPGLVTVTPLDQNGNPIAGIEVFRRSLAGVETSMGFTNGLGQVIVPQSDSAHYYYANADAVDAFSPGAGDKRSPDCNNRAAVVDISTSPSDGDVSLGTTVTETIKVTDTNGDPISNRPVRIKREGPGDNSETVFKSTNDNGELTYSFTCNVEGVANIEVGISGPIIPPFTDIFQYAVGHDTVNCKNPAPPQAINVKLSGRSSQGKDILRVNAPSIAKGASVILQKKVNGKWKQVGKTKKLDGAGNRQFGTKDRNGKKVTKFRAKVAGNSVVLSDTSPVARVK